MNDAEQRFYFLPSFIAFVAPVPAQGSKEDSCRSPATHPSSLARNGEIAAGQVFRGS